jgi:predicted O-methyltransferase YrrM
MRSSTLAILLALCSLPALGRADGGETEDPAARVIRDFEFKRGRYNVPPYDGKLLHDLILKHRPKRILELGTSNGYSALWMGVAAKKIGAKLITVEIDRDRWSEAVENLRKAGLADTVDARLGDAFDVIATIEGEVDFVFIDIWKSDYIRAFKLLKPRLPKGGLFTAHNVCQKMKGIAEFLEVARGDADFETRVDCESGAGVSISVKK